MSDTPTTEAARLADQLERAFRGGAWHGPSVLEALDGCTADRAARRPIAAAHTVAEITGHLITWIDMPRQRILGTSPERVTDEQDFPTGLAASDETWSDTLRRLDAAHQALHDLVAGLDDERLDDPVPGSDPTVRGLVLGVLQHNTYHAGQIVLLRKSEEALAADRENVA